MPSEGAITAAAVAQPIQTTAAHRERPHDPNGRGHAELRAAPQGPPRTEAADHHGTRSSFGVQVHRRDSQGKWNAEREVICRPRTTLAAGRLKARWTKVT
mmetsp:Transcript_63232/g.117650  ORF Transcript_63232/g.117650 Transcript_63232/m.117650 type:complete len:100 (+) Transcript_63232:934-1233(+)